MKVRFQQFAMCLSAILWLGSVGKSNAFALLGPAQPWMQATNGVYFSPSYGGPMYLGNEYRWNVPVVTYGFDQSFLDYFGTNGVAAVEGAIQILNSLPSASQIVLTNYPFDSQHINYEAQSQSADFTDLKSQTLATLLGNLGLTSPTLNTYVLRSWDPSYFTYPSVNNGGWSIDVFGIPVEYENDPLQIDPGASGSTWGTPGYVTNFVAGFNYDPQTLQPSLYVNEIAYDATITIDSSGYNTIAPYPLDAEDPYSSAVADSLGFGNPGLFYTALTYDDVGGLTYLLNTNNVNYENLLPNIIGVGTNKSNLVNGAWRPGVDKITFVLQPISPQSGAFLPTTNFFTDSYITNGVLRQQTVARIISQPDFLFSAGDITSNFPGIASCDSPQASNWLNNATANGNTNGAGPGVIPPPIQITFGKIGPEFISSTSEDQATYIPEAWASFDGSTNAPVIYPTPQTGITQMTVRLWLQKSVTPGGFTESVQWQPRSTYGSGYEMQTSTNLANWTTLFTVTNNGSTCTYFNQKTASTSRFYRLIPQ